MNITCIYKPKLKNTYLSISKDLKIVLKTPHASHNFIMRFLNDKEAWIRKKLQAIKINAPLKIKIEDEVLLFGEVYSIDMQEVSVLRIKLEKNRVNTKVKSIKLYDTFYKNYAKEYITKRVEYFADIMKLEYDVIKYRKMKSRWGSCSSLKVLTFNTELMKTKKNLIDYVVVHELSHLKHMNHSKAFHAFVDSYLQNSQLLRKELKNTSMASF
nr:SprT family zinc-dependent metalloprotease [Sulfurimonas sp. SAG-AH-194-I05]